MMLRRMIGRATAGELRIMLRRLAGETRGSTAVEFGLLAPALMLVLVGTIEFGRLLWTQSALNYGVQEAARCASVNTTSCSSPTATQNYAASKMGCSSCSGDFTASTPACGNKVVASYPFPFMFKFTTITLSAQSCFPL
jgi:Flp pilus assembly protein TadG